MIQIGDIVTIGPIPSTKEEKYKLPSWIKEMDKSVGQVGRVVGRDSIGRFWRVRFTGKYGGSWLYREAWLNIVDKQLQFNFMGDANASLEGEK